MKRKIRVAIDSDVFLIELRYPRDSKAKKNKDFLNKVKERFFVGYTTIYNLMEICGILSFNLSDKQIEDLFIGFPEKFNVNILFPEGDSKICYKPASVFGFIKKKMSFGDALIADLIQQHKLDLFVTWNIKHFKGKLSLPAVSPEQVIVIRN